MKARTWNAIGWITLLASTLLIFGSIFVASWFVMPFWSNLIGWSLSLGIVLLEWFIVFCVSRED